MRLAVLALAGCGTAPVHVAPPADDGPEVGLAIVRGSEVRFATASARGLVVDRTVATPSAIHDFVWHRGEGVVMLDDGAVGYVSSTGYVPMAMPPPSTWTITPAEPREHFERPMQSLFVGGDGALWRGQCEWGGFEDGGWCDQWVYGRLVPRPVVAVRDAPRVPGGRVPPEIAPPPGIAVSIVKVGDLDILRCTRGGVTVDYPAADDRGNFFGMSDVVWLARDPPLFRAIKAVNGYEIRYNGVVFEGCAESSRFAGAQLAVGRDDMVALYTGELVAVYRRGVALGTLQGGGSVHFR